MFLFQLDAIFILIGEDRVERVSRKTDKRPNPLLSVDDDEEEESGAASFSRRKIKAEVVEEDLPMDVDEPEEKDDEVVVQAKPKRKREKKVVPVGRNGIKKRKVTKSRTFKDEQGYLRKLSLIIHSPHGSKHCDRNRRRYGLGVGEW